MKKPGNFAIIQHNGGERVKEEEVLQLLQHYRHDILNELQLLKGYVTLGKLEKVEEIMNNWVEHFDQERQLFRLHAPKWTIWLLRAKYRYHNIRVHVDLQLKSSLNLSAIDEQLVTQSEQVVTWLMEHGDREDLYVINIKVIEKNNVPNLILRFHIHGLLQPDQALESLEGAKRTEEGIECEWSYLVN